MILIEDTGDTGDLAITHALHPERLETGELQKVSTPRDSLLRPSKGIVEGEIQLLYGRKLRRHYAAHLHCPHLDARL